MNENADLLDLVEKLQKTDPSLEWVYFELVRGAPGFWGFQPAVLGRDDSATEFHIGQGYAVTRNGSVSSIMRRATPEDIQVAERLRLIVNQPHNLNAIVYDVIPHKFAALNRGNIEVTSEGCLLICLRELRRALKIDREPNWEYPFRHTLKLRAPRGFKGFIVQYYMTENVRCELTSGESNVYSQLKPRLNGLNLAPFYFAVDHDGATFDYEDHGKTAGIQDQSDLAKATSLIPALEQHITPLLDEFENDARDQTAKRFVHQGILLVAGEPPDGPRSLEDRYWLSTLDHAACDEQWEPYCCLFTELDEQFAGFAAFFQQTKVIINTVELP